MGAARLAIVLCVAAVAAFALAFLVRQMAAGRQPVAAPVAAAAPEKPMTRVLVAKHDLKIAQRLTADDLVWQNWPADTVNPAWITGGAAVVPATLAAKAATAVQAVTTNDAVVQSLQGSLVREPILANEPISQRKLVRGGAGGFMAVELPAGMRAMSVPVTVDSDAGGFVLPGDRVDVVQSIKLQATADAANAQVQAPMAVSRIVLRNIKVLAIDQAAQPKANAASLVGATATLEVPADDVETLARSKAQGDIALVLRSYADAGQVSGRTGHVVAATDVVRVHRDGQITEVRVPQ